MVGHHSGLPQVPKQQWHQNQALLVMVSGNIIPFVTKRWTMKPRFWGSVFEQQIRHMWVSWLSPSLALWEDAISKQQTEEVIYSTKGNVYNPAFYQGDGCRIGEPKRNVEFCGSEFAQSGCECLVDILSIGIQNHLKDSTIAWGAPKSMVEGRDGI